MFQSLVKYSLFIRWLIRQSILRNKGLACFILITGALGVLFQVKVFALIVYYAKHFQSGETLLIRGNSLDPRASVSLLAFLSGGIVLFLCFAAGFVYLSRRSTLHLGQRFEEQCAKQVFHRIGAGVNPGCSSTPSHGGEKYLLRLVRGDAQWANRMLITAMGLLVPVLTFLAVGAVLLYLDAVLTSVLVLLMGSFALLQYRINRKAAAYSVAYEAAAPLASRHLRDLLRHFGRQPQYGTGDDRIEKTFAFGPVKRQWDAFVGRYGIVEESKLASGVFLALVLGITLLVMGTDIIREGRGWGRLLIYIVALRFVLVNMQTIFAGVTSINRYYPQVSRIFWFLQEFREQDSHRFPPHDEYILHAGRNRLEGSLETLKVGIGHRLALITPMKLDRYTLAPLTRILLGDSQESFLSALHSMRFATGRHSCPETSLRSVLGLQAAAEWSDLETLFPDEALRHRAARSLPGDLDKRLTAPMWDALDAELKFLLSLISAAHADCRWVFMEEPPLKRLRPEIREFYLNLLEQKITVIVFSGKLDWVGRYGERAVAVADENELLGIGEAGWFRAIRAKTDDIPAPPVEDEEDELREQDPDDEM